MSISEKYLGGHIKIGAIVIYGENAMHWGVNIETRWGYICFRLPLKCFGRWWPLYFYISPNATPWASTFYWGADKVERARATLRRAEFGHNYDTKDPVIYNRHCKINDYHMPTNPFKITEKER